MAKQQNNPEPGEVVIFFARARGGAAVTESVRALADAVERAARPGLPPRVVKSLATDPKREDKTLFDPVEQPDTLDREEDTADIIDVQSTPTQRQKRGVGPKTDRNAGIAVVPNLDFVPKGKSTLKSYFAEKAPSSDMDKVLVLSHYLQHTMGLSTFGPGHILTAYKHVEQPLPVDLRATIRNMKGKAWLNFTEIESISMATEGDNRVAHSLPKTKKAAK